MRRVDFRRQFSSQTGGHRRRDTCLAGNAGPCSTYFSEAIYVAVVEWRAHASVGFVKVGQFVASCARTNVDQFVQKIEIFSIELCEGLAKNCNNHFVKKCS